ncbi:subtilisin-like serine protease [Linnemannia exigua]|uniref:Subtilisin-like serine protease n=1 Tax=Linnemannia exigua TaxID=604196 RepID=A0AAD4DIT4_9FUNG|nr:subtilisin-like serine protease [Linnemannia exigua]
MKPQLILLLSLAVASMALAAEAPAGENAQQQQQQQAVFAAPDNQVEAAAAEQPSTPSANNDADKKNKDYLPDVLDPTLAYVYDVSKKATRGYDIDGRQEVVNIGPGLRTTADGQTQSRSGPRGRQRGAVLPNKYIVKLKNGADFSSINLRSKIEEHNRLSRLPPKGEEGAPPQSEQQKLQEEDYIPNQVDHEYDFGTWKGYAGQFSPEFLKELEAHDEVEYVEEDTMMWAWGYEPKSQARDEVDNDSQEGEVVIEEIGDDQEESLNQAIDASFGGQVVPSFVNETATFEADAIINGHGVRLNYYSLKAPSWGLSRIATRRRDIQKDYTYMSTAGNDVDVYIVDSGVYSEHSDFENRASTIANFVTSETQGDTCGHGTHVAGIVAGRRYGVAKRARILAVKVLDSEGQGSTSQVLAGINFVINHAVNNPNPKKVINMSLGGEFSRPVNDAVRLAVTRHGLPFFVAAGNSGDDACQYSPAGVEEAFAVGGSDRWDKIGWYSCTGSCVKIFAPGSGIPSNWIHSPTAAHILDGTSMATPHVTGVAALFMGAGRNYNNARELYKDILDFATPDVITGTKGGDWRTPHSLLYNKLEDINDSVAITPQDGRPAEGSDDQRDLEAESSSKKKTKAGGKKDDDKNKKKKKGDNRKYERRY